MALPFIAGLALGALGVVAYKNRDIKYDLKFIADMFWNLLPIYFEIHC